jgi:hypothetical protein
MHPAALSLDDLKSQCDLARTRRSGPGGQHRNKVETAVVITHRPTGISAQASERRSQAENLSVAWQRLRIELALGVREPWPAERAISTLWHSRARGGKLRVSVEHEDFGPLLAEALDRLVASAWEVPVAAAQLGISSTQLIKLLASAPAALAQLNAVRKERGQHPLTPP